MKNMDIIVIGAGQMGSGIAQVAAQSGYKTYLYDVSAAAVHKSLETINNNLTKNIAKNKITEEEKQQILERVVFCKDIEDAKTCGLVIEAIVENMQQKADIFRALDDICLPESVFASNTSSLPITELAAYTKRPDRFIGMHFMQPVTVMSLIEIIRGIATSDKTYEIVKQLTLDFNKYPVEVRDVPGFVSNRVLQVMINEAIFCVYENVASVEGIDEIMKRGMNHPMGPLALADFIGLDTVLSILEIMHKGYGDPKYRPCPLLRQYVNAGWLGRKSGRGFYAYN